MSYFLTITLRRKKECEEELLPSHTPCKQTRSVNPLGMKTTGICWGLEAKRTKNEKPLSHSDNSVLLTPSPHYDYKDLAALRGPSDPRLQLERLERSRDKSRRVSWPNNPNTPFHLIQLAEQQDDCGLNSKQHQSGGYRKPKWQTAQGSPLATQRT